MNSVHYTPRATPLTPKTSKTLLLTFGQTLQKPAMQPRKPLQTVNPYRNRTNPKPEIPKNPSPAVMTGCAVSEPVV